ncbi:unnamed protein product [Schistocephalus solidus]|uniref:C2H2-type domain-containing protein n=1 Tax=Schistocephalus solidus TaxID=70667 RepID=A0A183TAH6_SCHSO|nr:unnamed protein product [Schistocephalus solidus]
MKPTELTPQRPKELHESPQRPGLTKPMHKPFQHASTVNAPSATPADTPSTNYLTSAIKATTLKYPKPVTFTIAATTTTPVVTTSDKSSVVNCPHCVRTFTSRIGLVGQLQIRQTETGEPVSGAPTHSIDHRLHCPHCLRAFTHRMGLFSHMRIHDRGIHANVDKTDTTCTPSAPANVTAIATPTNMNENPLTPPDFACPHCTHNFTSRIGLVVNLRIHRTDTEEPVPWTPHAPPLLSLLPPIESHAPPR